MPSIAFEKYLLYGKSIIKPKVVNKKSTVKYMDFTSVLLSSN